MDNRECMVSVLCTAYNHEKYLRDALDSFVNQKTDFVFEVLVNDDCSTDGTAAIIREYSERYPDIIRPFFQQKNLFSQGGMPFLFDTVFAPNARGKYVALCEGDDFWCDPDKLYLQVHFLEEHPEYSGCVHNTVCRFCAGEQSETLLVKESGDRDVDYYTVLKGMSRAFHTSSILTGRELVLDPPDFYRTAGRYGFTDYAIGLWMTLRGKVRFIDRPMSVYRIASNADAWSSGQDENYSHRVRFVTGEAEMMKTMLHHLDDEQCAAAKREILEREYELLYLSGDVDKLVKPPYDVINREKPLSFRAKNTIKRLFPVLHRIYRKKQGYEE